ncbi:MAG: hypothetical protein HC863_01750 [Myxococcales bacterium]|nr:hypothetical protein [Myxococcales bacterium]
MLSAVVVALWTAWYLGMRAGIIAGIATAAALLLAQFVPGASLAAYVLVVIWCAALYFVIPKLNKNHGSGAKSAAQTVSTLANQANNAIRWAKKFLQQ